MMNARTRMIEDWRICMALRSGREPEPGLRWWEKALVGALVVAGVACLALQAAVIVLWFASCWL